MRRLTTPTHTFLIPFQTSELKEIKITYAQNGKIILSKYMQDCVLRGQNVEVNLTQKETQKFSEFYPCKVQIRALTNGGQAIASKIINMAVLPVLDDEVLL